MYNKILIHRLCFQLYPEVDELAIEELGRQQHNIQLMASENFASPAVMASDGQCADQQICQRISGQALLWWLPICDIVENIAIQRAKELFGADCVNIPAHSGAQANMAVYFALINLAIPSWA